MCEKCAVVQFTPWLLAVIPMFCCWVLCLFKKGMTTKKTKDAKKG